jgi:hypothetical protein
MVSYGWPRRIRVVLLNMGSSIIRIVAFLLRLSLLVVTQPGTRENICPDFSGTFTGNT